MTTKMRDHLRILLGQWNWRLDLSVVSSVVGLTLLVGGMVVLLGGVEPPAWFARHLQEIIVTGGILVLPGYCLLTRTVR